MVASHALLVADLEAVFALANLRDIITIDQLFFVHAHFTHLFRLVAVLAISEMLLDQSIIVIDLFLEIVGLADELDREVAISQDQKLVVLETLRADQLIPFLAFDLIEHFMHDTAQDE